MTKGSTLRLESAALLAPPLPALVAPEPARDSTALEEVERQHILAVLQQARWRIEGARGAAQLLDLEPSTLRSRMKKLGIARGASEATTHP